MLKNILYLFRDFFKMKLCQEANIVLFKTITKKNIVTTQSYIYNLLLLTVVILNRIQKNHSQLNI